MGPRQWPVVPSQAPGQGLLALMLAAEACFTIVQDEANPLLEAALPAV